MHKPRTRNNGRPMQGFFFTVLALTVLSFMLMAMNIWTRTFEQQDLRSAERFKGEGMRLIMSTISDESLSKFANSSAYYATYTLAEYTSEPSNPLPFEDGQDPFNPGTKWVEKIAEDLIVEGEVTSISLATPPLYDADEKKMYTFKSWREKITQAADAMGYVATLGDPMNFAFKQSSPWEVEVSFDVDMEVSDREGRMHASKVMHADTRFQIDGFLDPAIKRNDIPARGVEPDGAAERQIFRNVNYAQPSDLAPYVVEPNGLQGHGWFFGPITYDYPGEGIFTELDEIAKMRQYILVTGYTDELRNVAAEYGAIILTDRPAIEKTTFSQGGCKYEEFKETRCLNCMRTVSHLEGDECPFGIEVTDEIYMNDVSNPVLLTGGDWASILDQADGPFLFGKDRAEKYLLIENEYDSPDFKNDGFHWIYDITGIRDMAICGFYVAGSRGPSFFQRMLATSMDDPRFIGDYGIETFVLGTWAGGVDDPSNGITDEYSRLDREFYGGELGTKLKGMPGCKSAAMCRDSNDAPKDEGLGKFRLSDDAINRFVIGDLSCGTIGASCEGPWIN